MNILIRLTTDNNLTFRKGAVGDCKVILRTIFDGGVLKLFVFKVLVWNYMLKIISNQKLRLI